MRMAFIITKVLFAIALLFLPVACAGVKCSVKADHVDKPISFTPCIYDKRGEVIRVSDQDILGHFKIKKRFWAMFWRSVNLTQNDLDVSDDLNKEMSLTNGDAIVNMTLVSEGDWWWYFSSLVPIIPDYHLIVLEGDVVRFNSEVKTQ